MKKNLITVLKKLLKAFGGDDESVQNNAVDIIDKIADNASGSGSGGGNVLTLYVDAATLSESSVLYKNIECTEGYSSIEEANEALLAATYIRVAAVYNESIVQIYFTVDAYPANDFTETEYDLPNVPRVYIYANDHNLPLYIENYEQSDDGK